MLTDRWEIGSDFDYPAELTISKSAEFFGSDATFWHSGRDCLRALIATYRGRIHRLMVPSFYCPDVAYSLQADGVEVVAYPDMPDRPLHLSGVDFRTGDAVLVVNTFGLRPQTSRGQVPCGVMLIEDHTHDPFSNWAGTSSADFCFASLRKWLPLPDGAVLWTGRGKSVPKPAAPPAPEVAITLARLSGMVIKSAYLAGSIASKGDYRTLFAEAEAKVGCGEPGPMSEVATAILAHSPASEWRVRRLANWQVLMSEIRRRADGTFRILEPASGCVPFAGVLVAKDAAVRAAALDSLRRSNVYPAVLWPITAHTKSRITGVEADDIELSERILALHCDHRYGGDDMYRVATVISEVTAPV